MRFVGIDPGSETGFAVWDTEVGGFMAIETVSIHEALFRVEAMTRYTKNDLIVIFEDARQRKWIPRERSESQYRGRLMGAGSVKRDCTIWEDFCKDRGIAYEAIPPRAGATKWSEEYFKAVTGWKRRTSNHARDAALLVFQRKR